jgi:hypothetical protein
MRQQTAERGQSAQQRTADQRRGRAEGTRLPPEGTSRGQQQAAADSGGQKRERECSMGCSMLRFYNENSLARYFTKQI